MVEPFSICGYFTALPGGMRVCPVDNFNRPLDRGLWKTSVSRAQIRGFGIPVIRTEITKRAMLVRPRVGR